MRVLGHTQTWVYDSPHLQYLAPVTGWQTDGRTGGGSIEQELDSCPDVSAHAQRHAYLPSPVADSRAWEEEREGGFCHRSSTPYTHKHTHTYRHTSTARQLPILMLWYDRCCVRCFGLVPWARLLRLRDPKWSFHKRKKYSQQLSAQWYTRLAPNRRGGVVQNDDELLSQGRFGVQTDSTVWDWGSSTCWRSHAQLPAKYPDRFVCEGNTPSLWDEREVYICLSVLRNEMFIWMPCLNDCIMKY